MANHEFTNWTALPNGIVGDTVRLSIFITPKLLGEAGTLASLDSYQSILKWPETISGLKLRVEAEIDGSGSASLVVVPENKGELGPSAAIWSALFSANTLVEPVSAEQSPAAAAASRRTVPIYYRSAPLQALVEETYAVHARMALSDLEGEPSRPRFVKEKERFDSPDALLMLASGYPPALSAPQFARRVGEGKEEGKYAFRPSEAVTQFFDKEKTGGLGSVFSEPIDKPFTRAQIGDLFNAFSLYRKRGIQNRLRHIRARRRWTSTDPNFNFYSSDTVEITKGDHGKEYEFAEFRITVLLPELEISDKGFEVYVVYSPNEGLPSPSNDADESESNLRLSDEIPGRYDPFLSVEASGANLFQDGTTRTAVAALRAKRISWDGAHWAAFDRNELDFHAILSALTSYPSLLRRLGWIFDAEITVGDLFPHAPTGTPFTGRIRVEPLWADPANAPTTSSPWTMYKVRELTGVTEYGIELVSFSPRADPTLQLEGVAAGFRDLSESRSFQYDLDAAVIKTTQKAIREADQDDRYLPSYRIEIPGSPRAAELNATKRAAELGPVFI